MDSIQINTLTLLAGVWQAEADSGTGTLDRRATLRECADVLRMLCEARFEDCPHAAPHRYCAVCPVRPCPIGLGANASLQPAARSADRLQGDVGHNHGGNDEHDQ